MGEKHPYTRAHTYYEGFVRSKDFPLFLAMLPEGSHWHIQGKDYGYTTFVLQVPRPWIITDPHVRRMPAKLYPHKD